MKVDEFVKYARTDKCVQTGALKTALYVIDRQREALLGITGVGILDPGKDTPKTARMREIAHKALEMEV